MKVSEVKIGQEVCYVEAWSDNIIEGTIQNIIQVNDTPCCVLKEKYGTETRAIESLYPPVDACKKAMEEESKQLIAKYKAEIKTLEDLIRFPLNHNVGSAEEYTNYEAIAAYKERANELGYVV